MDRHFEIAMVAGTLAALWAYALRQRLRAGNVQLGWGPISRAGSPSAYWSLIVFLALLEVTWIGVALTSLVSWLMPHQI